MIRKSRAQQRQLRELANLSPMEQLRAGRMTMRLVQLVVGLAIYGAALALVIRATLGQVPWDVLHVGLTKHFPLTVGTVIIIVSLLVLLLWIPLRQKPGLGTIANALLVGPAADITLAIVEAPTGLAARIALLVFGVVLNGAATAMYVGAQLGPGPRDGLMTGLSRVTGGSLRLVRTLLEVAVVLVGWALGGAVGVGTALYAVAIGPLTQSMLPWMTVPLPSTRPAESESMAVEPMEHAKPENSDRPQG